MKISQILVTLVAVSCLVFPRAVFADARLAPDFDFECPQGHLHSLSDLRGQVVVIDFWASWCPPCRLSLPELQALYEEYSPREVVFLGVNSEDRETIEAAEAELGLSFYTVGDEYDEIAMAFDVDAIPRTIVIGPDGRIVADFRGMQLDDSIERAILSALHS